ncbi:HIT family protein [Sutcliffiella horikoshii]|uniref:HIT family protein n=1 Tax=Sutcliffiella horikoshii TaxID=79883 RepID=A0AA94WQH4_9BACI|nr:HIT family protein [Sutcliffiella horikoshii]TYS58546.1 HIT family protein [Sutcliffiella horikoshii]
MQEIKDCLGCRLSNKTEDIYMVYEDDYVTCFLDHAPFNEGHTLILPKQHFLDVDELDDKTANAIIKASILLSKALKRLYQPDGITINQNGGVFNDLTHYHMHVVPRYKGQWFGEFYREEVVGEVDVRELERVRERMVEAIAEVMVSEELK